MRTPVAPEVRNAAPPGSTPLLFQRGSPERRSQTPSPSTSSVASSL
jgi:hypothetical protein